MASLAVIDPSSLFRAGLAVLVGTMGFEPTEEAATVGDLIQAATDAARPDLVLAGAPPRLADVEALLREIREWAPAAKVVLIAAKLETPTLIASFVAGASGYLLDTISREALKHSLLLVSVGENVFPSELAKVLRTSQLIITNSAEVTRELRDRQITEREVEILGHLAKGEANHAIAALLGVPESAISAEIRQILRKLRLANRTQAALWAVAKGLAAPLADGDRGNDARG